MKRALLTLLATMGLTLAIYGLGQAQTKTSNAATTQTPAPQCEVGYRTVPVGTCNSQCQRYRQCAGKDKEVIGCVNTASCGG